MSSPANDNFSNAIYLGSLISGSTTGTNVGATSEAGEPTNNGKTVWYSWQAPVNTNVYFSTCYNTTSLINPKSSSLATVLQVFTVGPGSSIVSNLTESVYVSPQTFKIHNNHWDIGSKVVFTAASQSTYYIRVDGVSVNNTASQGDFPLSWDQYQHFILGNCSTCPPMVGCGWECLGSLTLSVLNSSSAANFGSGTSYPSGSYYIKYCKGSFVIDNSTDPAGHSPGFQHTVIYGGSIFTSSYGVTYITASGAVASSSFDNLPPYTDMADSLRTYFSPNEAQEAFLQSCTKKSFIHYGGQIGINFYDQGPNNNIQGTPSPVFGLYRFKGLPQIDTGTTTACAAWVTPGVSSTVTFNVFNNSIYPAYNVTATLLSGSGISSPSAPQTGITIVGNGYTPITFTFNNTSHDIPATIVLNIPDGVCGNSAMTFNLAPIINVTTPSITGPSARVFCSTDAMSSWTLQNIGNWNIGNLTATMSLQSGLHFFEGQDFGHSVCITSSLHTDTIGSVGCNSAGISFFFPITTFVSPGGASKNVIMNINDDAGLSILNNTYSFFFP